MTATQPLVSIIVPHFQTPELARLCLRSIRRFTYWVPYEVVVVDNGSKDGASLDYLRTVEWIKLIERTENIGPVAIGHKEAVDIGIAASSAPYVLAFHTDTIPIREDWLAWHLLQIQAAENVGAVGTYKLELKSSWQSLLKKFEWLPFLKKDSPAGIGDDHPYIRSHCGLYRRDLLEQFDLKYNVPDETAGRNIHMGLIENGYEARLLDVEETLERVVHLNHGTMVLLPELGARRRTIRRGKGRISRFLSCPEVQAVYHDESLDRAGETPTSFSAEWSGLMASRSGAAAVRTATQFAQTEVARKVA